LPQDASDEHAQRIVVGNATSGNCEYLNNTELSIITGSSAIDQMQRILVEESLDPDGMPPMFDEVCLCDL
jgi:hypothetical protein